MRESVSKEESRRDTYRMRLRGSEKRKMMGEQKRQKEIQETTRE